MELDKATLNNIEAAILAIAQKLADRRDYKIAASAYLSANVSIANATITTIVADTEYFDIGDNYDASTGIFTCPYDGVYIVSANAMILDPALNTDQNLYIYKSGSIIQRNKKETGVANHDNTGSITLLINCVAGDTLEARIYHDHGASRNLQSGSYTSVNFGLFFRTD